MAALCQKAETQEHLRDGDEDTEDDEEDDDPGYAWEGEDDVRRCADL